MTITPQKHEPGQTDLDASSFFPAAGLQIDDSAWTGAIPPKPVTLSGDLENLPKVFDLCMSKRLWVCWSWEWRGKKWTKPPKTPSGSHASSTNPETWCWYGEALAAVRAGKVDGIGIALMGLKDSEIFLDLDDCRDPATGTINAWARELVDLAASYTEVTPSGTGLRVVGRAKIGSTHRKFNNVDGAGSSLEVYSCGESRYVTVTGIQVDGCWPNAGDITELARRLVRDKGMLDPAKAEMSGGDQPRNGKPFERAPAYRPGRIAEALGLPNMPKGHSLDDLISLIAQGVPEGQRSQQFHHAVGWAKRIGWAAERLEQVMRQHPTGIASKYLSPSDRLAAEITRCWGKVDERSDYERARDEARQATPGDYTGRGGDGNNANAGDTGAGTVSDEADGPECEGSAGQGTQRATGALWDPWREYTVPEFPLDVLPLDARQYVEARANETGACISAIAMSCLAALSGAITHEARLYLKHSRSFGVSPRLWVALVGDPSSKKSPAMDGAVRPLVLWQKEEQGAALRAWEEEFEALPKKDQKENPRPVLTHYVVNDLTPEALADILSKQDRGVLVVADELAGWLGSLDRYGSGKGALASRGIWLTAYNGGPYALHRIGRHTQPVNNLSVSLLGGIQIDRLRSLGDLTSDGLLQRFIPVMMRKSRLDSDSFSSQAYGLWDHRLRDLAQFGNFSIELSPEAKAERRRIAALLHDLGQGDSEGQGWQGFVGKLAGVWGSLALIMHVIWEPRVGGDLSLESAMMASRLIEDFVLPHGLAFYRAINGTAQANARAIGAFLAEWKGRTITARDFVRGPRCCREVTPEQINAILAPFETGGWVEPMKPGPLNRAWYVTPGLAEKFADGVAAHKEAVALVQEKIVRNHDDK